MTLTTTQLAGLDDDDLIDLASTDLERELAGRLTDALQANAELEDDRAQPVDTADARFALDTLRKCLAEAQECKAKLDEFINSL